MSIQHEGSHLYARPETLPIARHPALPDLGTQFAALCLALLDWVDGQDLKEPMQMLKEVGQVLVLVRLSTKACLDHMDGLGGTHLPTLTPSTASHGEARG